ncbi:putative ABC transport system ATP-binding protein [Clostridium amylolyticum]|uniref:Putative ABC transport system ATP-binding protein n=1 Tax=Clostridium amylolyticum TaxID=1121298 RepID=A0A1M6HHC7_9CLOT|nr:ABC transporter ATP-binding protein [Clostridium amylolyticum]SHJ21585.1 putative ABC transport system ATP-binding protein [Clostridium amylolyticum]
MIVLKNVSKQYKMGDNIVKALDNINLEVKEKEFVSIIGPSGSGKSTLMNILGCLDTPDTGSYLFNDINIEKANDSMLAELRNAKIGFIFQNFNLLPKLNAMENVEVPLLYRGISEKESRKLALLYLEKVGLKGREHHKPNELSGGQQQRVAIARALAGKPSLILADEPTGAIDSKTNKEIMQLIKDLHHEGHTIILITHDPQVAMQADRSIKIIDGRLYE